MYFCKLSDCRFNLHSSDLKKTLNFVYHSSLSRDLPSYSLISQFWFFGLSLPQKGHFRSKAKKKWTSLLSSSRAFSFKNIEYHNWFLHIWISLGTNFQLKMTMLLSRETIFKNKNNMVLKGHKVNFNNN